jgi:hypothetical protein
LTKKFCGIQRENYHDRKDGNDGDDNKKLNESEGLASVNPYARRTTLSLSLSLSLSIEALAMLR